MGSAPGLEVDAVQVSDDTLTPDTVFVSGAGFVDGMKVVLGRGTTPGLALPTTWVGPNLLEARIPSPFAALADDLFVAVLAADGSGLSASISYPRASLVLPAATGTGADREQAPSSIASGVDPDEVLATAQFGPDEVGVTSIQGGLFGTIGAPANQPQQSLLIQGANLIDGLIVKFRTFKGGQLLEKAASLLGIQTVATMPAPVGTTPTAPTALLRGTVAVPKEITDTPQMTLKINSAQAKSGAAMIQAKQPPDVPFGGRRSFAIYQGKGGDYRILASSELAANPNYQLVKDAVLSISKPAPNPNGFPSIQLERESGDAQNTARIRGTALYALPCDEIKKESPQLACAAAPRSEAQIQAVLNQKVVATRDLKTSFEPMGKKFLTFDATISLYADQYGVPPQFLKAQAIQESGHYTGNFRFEFTSINLKRLGGDGPGAFSGSTLVRQTPPFAQYLIGGKALGAYSSASIQAQAQKSQAFSFDPQNAGRTQFGLAVAVKRTVGHTLTARGDQCGRNECDPQVTAVVRVAATKAQVYALQLVHADSIWQKAGSLASAPSVSHGAGTLQCTAQQHEFTVNYDNGDVVTACPLQAGQELVVQYWPLGDGQSDLQIPTVVTVSAGTFANAAPDLNSAQIKEANKLRYSPGETLASFLANNVQANPRRGFLTTPDTGDRFVEFVADGNDQPTRTRDPRYTFITSQPYASSSYGFLQLTLIPFDNSVRGRKLKGIFDPSSTAIFQLLTQPETNFKLAAQFHKQSLTDLIGTAANHFTPCGPDHCTESSWEDQWYNVFLAYNTSGAGYNKAKTTGKTIIEAGASDYAPPAPQ